MWGNFRYFRITFSRKVVGPWKFLTSVLASVWRACHRTCAKTKIRQGPLINSLLFYNDTVYSTAAEYTNIKLNLVGVCTHTLEYRLQVIYGIRTCFCIYYFWTTIILSIINHPPYLKIVSNDAPFNFLQSSLKIRL